MRISINRSLFAIAFIAAPLSISAQSIAPTPVPRIIRSPVGASEKPVMRNVSRPQVGYSGCPAGTNYLGNGTCIDNPSPPSSNSTNPVPYRGQTNCDNPNIARYDTRCGGDPRLTPRNFGSQGVCPPGALYFANSDYLSYPNHTFCEDNSYSQSDVRYWAGYIARLTFANYTLYFKDDHIWPRHLACYLPGTNDQFYQAGRDDFFKIYLQGASPAPGGTEDYRIQYGSTSVIYRVYAVTADQYYSVGTAFIPGLPNCPGY